MIKTSLAQYFRDNHYDDCVAAKQPPAPVSPSAACGNSADGVAGGLTPEIVQQLQADIERLQNDGQDDIPFSWLLHLVCASAGGLLQIVA